MQQKSDLELIQVVAIAATLLAHRRKQLQQSGLSPWQLCGRWRTI